MNSEGFFEILPVEDDRDKGIDVALHALRLGSWQTTYSWHQMTPSLPGSGS